jgi:hypothetical protein
MSFKNNLHEAVKGFERGNSVISRVKIDDRYIIVSVTDTCTYEIPLDECCTVWGALGWITHVMEKTWITQEMLDRIFGLISDYALNQHKTLISSPHGDNGL